MTDVDPSSETLEAKKRQDEARLAEAGAAWRKRSQRVRLYRRLLPIVISIPMQLMTFNTI